MDMTARPLVLLAALVTLAACAPDGARSSRPPGASTSAGSSGSGSVPGARDTMVTEGPAVVTISRSRFDVPRLQVPIGTTVVFENTDEFAHTVTATEASPHAFGSDDLGRGDTFELTFHEPGDHPYFCRIHPTMRATVIVG